MSSNGILISINGAPLATGARIDIELDWPVERDKQFMKLVVNGRIIRSETELWSTYGVSIESHVFEELADYAAS